MSVYETFSTDSEVANECDLELQPVQKKAYNKMAFQSKVQIIAAVEKGQSKVDIGREFGVHPRTVTYIYKQKDSIINKYKRKFSVEIDCTTHVSQALLNWFVVQMSSNKTVTEDDMRLKAEEFAHSKSNINFKCTNEWLNNYRLCHNIVKHVCNTECDLDREACLEWSNLHCGQDESDIYIGGTCALLHRETFQSFRSNALNIENQVSILLLTNITGTDKRELTVVGREKHPTTVWSLPLKYHHKKNPQIDIEIIKKVLNDWDDELKKIDKKVSIVLNIPELCTEGWALEQIKIMKCSMTLCAYVSRTFEKIVNCFKYHYRRLQIIQALKLRSDVPEIIEYIRILSLAWHSVSSEMVRQIFNPRLDGCLYFDSEKMRLHFENEENERSSLTEWYKTHDIPFKLGGQDANLLDKFVKCDDKCCSLDKQRCEADVSEQETATCSSLSAIDTFQAIKRLLRYVQSENASSTIVNSAKILEDHLEYEARVEIQESIANDNIVDVD